MSGEESGGGHEQGDRVPSRAVGDDPLDALLTRLVDHVEGGGTASLEAMVADSGIASMDAFFERLRSRDAVTEMEATALVNAAYGETVEEVRAALDPDSTADEPEPAPTEHVEHPELASLDGVSDVLVLCPSNTDVDDSICRSLLTRQPPADQNVLVVSVAGDAEDRISLLQEDGRELPANVGVVGGRSGVRTTTTAPGDGESSTTITLESMPDPSDLPKLGITISRLVSEWEDNDRQTAVCFHSLTALLQYAGRQRVFRFVRVLQDRLESVGGVAHYHMDPEAHDRQTIATLRSLFDAVVEVTPGGAVQVTD